MKLFSIYDSKAESHVLWMTHENEDTMLREIKQRMAGTPMETFAEDYTLFEVATIDERSGKLLAHDALVSLTNLVSVFPKRVPDDGDQHLQTDLTAVQ